MILSKEHKDRFQQIRQRITALGSRESAFTNVELLFYEVLDISRSYGDDLSQNRLLAELRQLQSGAYQATKEHFRKARQRELVIRKFISGLKNAINPRAYA